MIYGISGHENEENRILRNSNGAVPGDFTGSGFPSILEIAFIRSAVSLTIESAFDEGTNRIIIKRVGIIDNPTSFIEIADLTA